jgi:hypothetical protein
VFSLKLADQILSRPKKQVDTDVTDLFMLFFTKMLVTEPTQVPARSCLK